MRNLKVLLYITFLGGAKIVATIDLVAGHRHHFCNARMANDILNIIIPVLNFIPRQGIDDILRNLCERGLPFNASAEGTCLLRFAQNSENWAQLKRNFSACQPIVNTNFGDLGNFQRIATRVMEDFFQGRRTCAPLVNQYINFARNPRNGCAGSIVWECQNTFERSCEDASRLITEVFQAQGGFNQLISGAVQAGNIINQHVVQPIATAAQQAGNAINQHVVQPIATAAQQAGNAINQHVAQPVANAFRQFGNQIARAFRFW